MVNRERDLVSTINQMIRTKYDTNIVTNEIRMGAGIPDVGFIDKRIDINNELPDLYAIRMLLLLYDKEYFEIKELQEISGYSLGLLKKTLRALLLADYFKRDGKKFLVVRKYNSLDVEASAIEAKLTDWRGGLFQAKRYLSFVDYSYLALPLETIRKVNLELLSEDGIGLISVSDSGDVEVVLTPRKSKLCNEISKYFFIEQMKVKITRR